MTNSEEDSPNPDQKLEARRMADCLGITVEEALVRLGDISASDIGSGQRAEFTLEFVELEGRQIPHSVIELVTESMAREHGIIPIALSLEEVVVAMHTPDTAVYEKLEFVLNREIRIVLCTLEDIQTAINRHYGPDPE